MIVLIYVAIGLVIGSVSGVLGIGGGVLLVPALIWLCGFPPSKAAGTSLAILIPPIGLPAVWHRFNMQEVDLWAAMCIAAAFTVGAYLSSLAATYVPEYAFRLVFGLLMIYIGVQFMLASSADAASAVAGLISTALAWLAFVGLKVLGRRHLPPPNLGQQIETMHKEGRGDPEYHI